MTNKELVDAFISYLRDERRYSNNTIIAYKEDIDCFINFLENEDFGELEDVSQKIANFYTGYLKDKFVPKSIVRKISSLNTMYKYLVDNVKYLDTNPFIGVVLPKVEKRLPKFIYKDEIDEFLNSIDVSTVKGIRDAAIFNLLASSGIRVSELTYIKFKDLNIDNRTILIHGKGSKDRIALFNRMTSDKIKNYIILSRPTLLSRSNNVECEYLFLNFKGYPLTSRGVRDILERVLNETSSALKITPHVFRHSFATYLLNNGMNVRMVQELLGHSNLSTTQIYTKLSKEALKETYNKAHPKGKDHQDD